MYSPPTIHDMLLRLALASLAGFILGFERESHGRAAGLRTTMLVCVASAMAMILSEFLFATSGVSASTGWRPDPARLAAGILTGIGFLGAGSIIRQENMIRGVTTAAVLWFVTVLGLAFGSGCLTLGGFGLGIAVVILFVLPKLENLIKNDWYATVTVTTELEGMSDEEVRREVERGGVVVKSMDFDYDLRSRQKTLRCEVKFKRTDLFRTAQDVMRQLKERPGVLQVKWA